MNSMPPSGFSANSKKIRRFNSIHRFNVFAYTVLFILPVAGGIFWYTQNRAQPEILSIPVQIAGFRGSNTNDLSSRDTMPEAVEAMIVSIERSGVSAPNHLAGGIDPTIITSGSTVSFDRKSWKSRGIDSGTIQAYVSTSGKVYNGMAILRLANGAWRISSFSVDPS
jgi:hypothetical protein